MEKYFSFIVTTRKKFIELIDSLSIEAINKIPQGFNNNIAWNFGHIIAAAQGLCYSLSNLPIQLDPTYILKYKKGSKPETFISADEIAYLKTIAISDIDQLKLDYNNGIFKAYNAYTTSFNFTLNNIEDAIAMVQSHDALHYGYAMAQKRILST